MDVGRFFVEFESLEDVGAARRVREYAVAAMASS